MRGRLLRIVAHTTAMLFFVSAFSTGDAAALARVVPARIASRNSSVMMVPMTIIKYRIVLSSYPLKSQGRKMRRTRAYTSSPARRSVSRRSWRDGTLPCRPRGCRPG